MESARSWCARSPTTWRPYRTRANTGRKATLRRGDPLDYRLDYYCARESVWLVDGPERHGARELDFYQTSVTRPQRERIGGDPGDVLRRLRGIRDYSPRQHDLRQNPY